MKWRRPSADRPRLIDFHRRAMATRAMPSLAAYDALLVDLFDYFGLAVKGPPPEPGPHRHAAIDVDPWSGLSYCACGRAF